MSRQICDACETVAHCMKNGCIPVQPTTNTEAMRAALDSYDMAVLRDLCATLEHRSPSRYRAMAKAIAALAQAEQRQDVPAKVMAALDRMCMPLHESLLSGATAREDARCMAVIRNYVMRGASSAAHQPEEPALPATLQRQAS